MTLKRNRKGETWHLCANENCRHKIAVQENTEDNE